MAFGSFSCGVTPREVEMAVPSRGDDERAYFVLFQWYCSANKFLDDWDYEGECFSRSCNRLGKQLLAMSERDIQLRGAYLYDDVFMLHKQRDGAGLDWSHLLKVERTNHVDSV